MTDVDHRPLSARGVTKRFDDVTALASVDLDLEHNEIIALVGPSGCGKSTLLRIIAGLTAADGGTVALGGAVVDDGRSQVPPERRRVGLVFQEHALFPHLTVADNIGFGVRDTSSKDRSGRVDEMLRLVGLQEFGERYPHELSGGERQRVALARALAPAPDIMLFDEPFASLDHNLRVQLRTDVVRALRATNTPAVFVTHDQAEALAIGDRIVVLRSGRCEQLGTASEIFHRPASAFVARFMGDASFLTIADTAEPRTSLGPIDLAGMGADAGVPVRAMVRPDDVQFDVHDDGDAEITDTEYRGSHWLLTVRLPDGDSVMVHASHLLQPKAGDRGNLSLVPGHRQVPVRD